MRAFDVLTKAEYEIRGSAQPRYHLEMALLRWIHLRKLVPLTDLIQGLEKGAPSAPRGSGTPAAPPARGRAGAAARPPPVAPPRHRRRRTPRPSRRSRPDAVEARRDAPARAAAAAAEPLPERCSRSASGQLKDAFLDEVRKAKKFFYGTVVAQAQRIEIEGDRVVFTFAPQHRALRAQLDQNRGLARGARRRSSPAGA